MRFACRVVWFCTALLVATLAAAPASAQPGRDDDEPAFSLSSGQSFTSRDSPHFYLTFRCLTRLDFRVYRVVDVGAFFAAVVFTGTACSANMSPPGREMFRCRASRSTNERATTSSMVLEALFSSIP